MSDGEQGDPIAEALDEIDKIADELPVRGDTETIVMIAGKIYELTDHIRTLRSQGR